MALPLLALTSLALVCAAAAEGCTLDEKLVCGDDGITYQNACLAQSQGIKLLQEQPCSDRTKSADPANLLATANLDTSGSASPDDMECFLDEDFKLIAKVHLVDTPMPNPTVATGKQSSTRSGPVFATRVTSAGFLYIQAVKDTVAPATGVPIRIAPFRPPNGTTPTSRKLLIYGTDDRVQVFNRAYPHSAVGQLVGQEANGDGYSCSATMVYLSSILTAGHCVYDAFAGAYSKRLNFYPGRLSKSDTNGVYPWAYVTTYWNNAHGHCNANGICNLDAFKYDIAVIRLLHPIGYSVGALGVHWEDARQGYSVVTSAGYPGEKELGTMWETSGTLLTFSGADAGIEDGTNGVVSSDLDITPGQSGSSVWDADFSIRALVNAEDCDGRAYHRTGTRSVFNFVLDNIKGIDLFSAENFLGEAITVLPGNHPRMPAAKYDNWASSAIIRFGCTATLYENNGYRGRKLILRADPKHPDGLHVDSLGTFDNKASSIKVLCPKT